jgi:hypothetical protein
MQDEKRAKILSKIQKCLALSKSCNEHEAAAALRQAQKMMTAHDVSERELGIMGYACEKVQVPIQATKVIPLPLSSLVNLISGVFGVRAVLSREMRVSDVSFVVEYYGPEGRVVLAGYAHTVVYRAMDKAWKTYLAENREMTGRQGARAGFCVGWLNAVRRNVEAFVTPDDERTATQELMESVHGDLKLAKRNAQRVSEDTMRAGSDAGREFRIHRPLA